MSDSETSSENINYKFIDEKEKPKIISSSTDMYFNQIANPAKEKQEEIKETSSITKSDDNDSESSVKSNKSSSSKKSKSSVSSKKSKSSTNSKKSFSNIKINTEEKNSDTKLNNSDKSEKSEKSEKSDNFYKPSFDVKTEKKLTDQEIRMKKIDLLRKLSEIKSKGYELSKKYDFNSSITEMEYEYELLKSFANKRNGIKLYKNIILNSASAIEFLNDKYDPFDFKLSGWSEHMSVEVDNYDDVLEELYEKYKGKGSNMPPEIKLIILMATSATAFHFTKSYAQNSMIEQALKNNPGLISGMLNKKKEESQFMTQQEINLQRQKEIAIEREKMQRDKIRKATLNQPTNNQNVNKPTNNQNVNNYERKDTFQDSYNPATQINNPTPKVNIQAPSNVQEILARLHQSSEKKNDRVVSETTVTTDSENKKKKRGRKKKSSLSVL